MHSPNPPGWAFVCYCVSLFYLDRKDDAKLALEDVYAQISEFSQAYVHEALRHHDKENVRHNIEALRALGVSE